MEQQSIPEPIPERPLRPVPGATQSTSSLFLRNATGLVRELTPFDAFNLVFSAVLVPIGFMDVMAFAPEFWPRANLFLSFLIAAPLLTCFGLVYLYFTVLMPRSGGDYVWVSRTLSPFLGFVVNVSLTYVFLDLGRVQLRLDRQGLDACPSLCGRHQGSVAGESRQR